MPGRVSSPNEKNERIALVRAGTDEKRNIGVHLKSSRLKLRVRSRLPGGNNGLDRAGSLPGTCVKIGKGQSDGRHTGGLGSGGIGYSLRENQVPGRFRVLGIGISSAP